MDKKESEVSKYDSLNRQLNSAPIQTVPVSTSYESVTGQQVPTTVPLLLACDPSPDYRNPGPAQSLGVATTNDAPEKNMITAWVDEFMLMSNPGTGAQVNFPAVGFQPTADQGLKATPSGPPPSYGAYQEAKRNHETSQAKPVPATASSPSGEEEKKHKCHLCNTSYATHTRLRRHFNTKKHKTSSEKMAASSAETSSDVSTNVTQPSRTKAPAQRTHVEKLPSFSTRPDHQSQEEQQPTGKLPHMPQFQSYSEYPHIDSYPSPSPSDWQVFHSQFDLLRSTQTLMSPTTESQHIPNNSLFFHQPNLNPDVYYNKLSFNSLCSSYQSSHNQIHSPQYGPESTPAPDQSRSFVPTSNYYQTQSPASPSPWYYPITPYPSPTQYFQRNAYSDFSTHEPYQKFESNNNYFPLSSDSDPSAVFDQRSLQQEALNLWTPKIVNPELDISVKEVDEISDDSETMSPVVSPDSQYEAVSSTEYPDMIPNPDAAEEEWSGNEAEITNLRCELCNRDFSKLCYLTQHNNAFHQTELEHPFRCNICDKSYSKMSLLVKHSSKHTGSDKPFKCDVCDKQFGYKVDLTRHKFLHSGNKDFNCHLCPKGCVRKDQLIRHLRVHESHGENVS